MFGRDRMSKEPRHLQNDSQYSFVKNLPEDGMDLLLLYSHFHGNQNNNPLTAIIPLPKSDKAAVILQGRYQVRADNIQLVRPTRIMDDLMQTIFTVHQFVLAAMLVVT